ncbi:MAG: hypothetical protein ABIO92_06135 [Chloroflexia bacterium]
MNNQKGPSTEFLRIAALKPRQQEAIILKGEKPDRDALLGWEYRGMNLGRVARLLGIRKFIKGFYRATDGQTFGYNVRARQNSPAEAWVDRLTAGKAKRFGFYLVLPVDPEGRDNAYLHALLLDYGHGGNGRYDITALLRDYLVRVNLGSDDLLLGKAYLALGSARVSVGYFLLERHQPLPGTVDRPHLAIPDTTRP